jgi:hypothetical protein
MPNWCHDELTVSGDPVLVAAFVEKVGTPGQPLTFAAHVPQPDGLGEGWYGWRLDHWGTKWDAKTDRSLNAFGTEVAIDALNRTDGAPSQGWVPVDGGLAIKFETAWSPPSEWIREVSVQEPELSFVLRWAEPGNDMAGEIRARAGQVTEQALAVADVLTEEEMWF